MASDDVIAMLTQAITRLTRVIDRYLEHIEKRADQLAPLFQSYTITLGSDVEVTPDLPCGEDPRCGGDGTCEFHEPPQTSEWEEYR